MKYPTDLILGDTFCIFIQINSGLSVLNGLHFTFDGVM